MIGQAALSSISQWWLLAVICPSEKWDKADKLQLDLMEK